MEKFRALVHICTAMDPLTMRQRVAKGVIAIGNIATGGVAVGGLSFGLLTFGGLSTGLLFAMGGLAVGLGLSIGGLAIGSVAMGGAALGFRSFRLRVKLRRTAVALAEAVWTGRQVRVRAHARKRST